MGVKKENYSKKEITMHRREFLMGTGIVALPFLKNPVKADRTKEGSRNTEIDWEEYNFEFEGTLAHISFCLDIEHLFL